MLCVQHLTERSGPHTFGMSPVLSSRDWCSDVAAVISEMGSDRLMLSQAKPWFDCRRLYVLGSSAMLVLLIDYGLCVSRPSRFKAKVWVLPGVWEIMYVC